MTPRAGTPALIASCLVLGVASVVAVPVTLGLGWDEVVYVSQHDPHGPAAFMSAPRARGVSVLVWPVASWLESTVALRLFLTATAAVSLGLAFGVWARLVTHWAVAPVAAASYATLWVATFYANAAMPNHYTAMAAVAAVGCYLLAAGERHRPGAYLGLVAALAVAALMRPADAFWLGLPLLAASLLVRRFRRWPLVAATVAGLAAGGVPWLVEAELRYGGLGERLRQASEVQGGTGLRFSLWEVMSTLDGPILCRPCDSPLRWPAALWWVAVAVLAVLGLRAARRAGVAPTAWLPLAVGASMAFPYLFLISYSAPRFLLPTYALVLTPAAYGLVGLVRATPAHRRKLLAAALVAGLAGHLAIQVVILRHVVSEQLRARGDWARVAQALWSHGVRPPCVVSGHEAIPVAYYAGCRALEDRGNNRNATTAELRRTAATTSFAFLVRDGAPPAWVRTWQRVPVRGLSAPGWVLYLPDRPPGATT
ncbi:hypothetical protein Q3W71_15800 [Micromonospora sp. C28SCA-DRY-2]|uniref:hypothetical protein n=1 Tax=Micromonospora sp. C28SCA-DRY-2 TaxID=3059522 RepID=UPI002674C747|nr:hypothetical protein [Micromonospora sp. C28SCA-DRY-2]MDO3703135.1 hypothetical protein [Micromonospora sp. C28SCA-DRY-2]